MFALTDEQSMENFAKCVSDSSEFVNQIENSWLLISTRREDNVLVGIDRLQQTIEKMPTKYLRNCHNSKSQLKKVQAWLKTYSSTHVAQNFEKLDPQMTVEYAKANFENKNDLYWEFGDQIGAFLKIFN